MSSPASPIKASVAWLGARTDEHVWLSPTITGVGTILAAGLLAFPAWWTVLIAMGALTLAVLTEVAASLWRKQEEEASGNAVVDAYLLLGTVLTPLATAAADLVRGAKFDLVKFGGVSRHAVDALAYHTSAKDARALLFLVDPSGSTMSLSQPAGRLGDSHGFDITTKRGRDAFEVLKAGKVVWVQSLEEARKEKPRAWSGSGEGYQTFITAPIAVGAEGYGLLTVDAPEPDAFSVTDRELVRLVAANLAVVLAERAKIESAEGASDGRSNP